MKLELTDLATSLDLPMTTVERWIRQGRIPIRKSGSLCVFKKAVLQKWAKKHDISFTPPSDSEMVAANPLDDSLLSVLKRGAVHHNVRGNTVEEVLKHATDVIPGLSGDDRSLLLGKLLERESLTSTGIGKGVAIPHPRTPMQGENASPMIATCFLETSIDFNSIDDAPVFVMFVIVCPTVKSHLSLLSRISFCLRDASFVSLLKSRPDSETFYNAIADIEKQLDKGR